MSYPTNRLDSPQDKSSLVKTRFHYAKHTGIMATHISQPVS
jgi:hypothetical protein